MKNTLFRITAEKLEERPLSEVSDKLFDSDAIHWLFLSGDDRGEAVTLLKEIEEYDSHILEWVANPGTANHVRSVHSSYFIDLPISSGYQSEAILQASLIISRDFIVTIMPEGYTIPDELIQDYELRRIQTQPTTAQFVSFLFNRLILLNTALSNESRADIRSLSMQMDTDLRSVSSKDILDRKQKLLHLSAVLDDQYSILSSMLALDWAEGEEQGLRQLRELLQLMEHLNNLQDRSEDRLDTMQLQYTIKLQESSDHRLKVLTIIQAVFVPLTFVAGIYGMNFKYMSELEWQYGYVTTLGLMGMSAIFSLVYFYRKGWFN